MHSTHSWAQRSSQACHVSVASQRIWVDDLTSLLQVREPSAQVEHEASTSKIGDDQLFYFQQRGIGQAEAVATIIGGFCREVFNHLPQEFSQEVDQLMSLKLEGSVG